MNNKTQKNLCRLIEAISLDLPARERAVLALCYIEELTFEEVGEILSMPVYEVAKTHLKALGRCIKVRQ